MSSKINVKNIWNKKKIQEIIKAKLYMKQNQNQKTKYQWNDEICLKNKS